MIMRRGFQFLLCVKVIGSPWAKLLAIAYLNLSQGCCLDTWE